MAQHVAYILDEGINESQKKDYYDHEVNHFFNEAIKKDIELSNIRLENDLVTSV